jgi:hypothetical protein
MGATEQTSVCNLGYVSSYTLRWQSKPFIWSVTARALPARRMSAYWRETVANRTDQEGGRTIKLGRFEALLDKLVAVQMDLEPVCGVGKERAQVVASLESIAEACEVLRSAIVDVRGIIYQVNSLTDQPEAVYG